MTGIALHEWVEACSSCGQFCVPHCFCPFTPSLCHNWKCIFTEGACRNNGRKDVTSQTGIGIAMGLYKHNHRSIAWSELPLDKPRRTYQRTELTAMLLTLFQIGTQQRKTTPCHRGGLGKVEHWLVFSDSKYAVEGVVDWLSTWKVTIRRSLLATVAIHNFTNMIFRPTVTKRLRENTPQTSTSS